MSVQFSSNDCRRQSLSGILNAGTSNPGITFSSHGKWGSGLDTCIAIAHLKVDSDTHPGTYKFYLGSYDGIRRWVIDFVVTQ
jgi:hypothetical protein